jgi:hypothetical protein
MHWIIQCYYGQQTLDCKVSPESDIAFSEGGPKCWFAVIPKIPLEKNSGFFLQLSDVG